MLICVSIQSNGKLEHVQVSDLYCAIKLPSLLTADKHRPMLITFLSLVGYDREKKLPTLSEDTIQPRSTPAVSTLHSWCPNSQIPLFSTCPRPYGWPIPVLYNQSPTYPWHIYAHYTQHMTSPDPYARSGLVICWSYARFPPSRSQINTSCKFSAIRYSYYAIALF